MDERLEGVLNQVHWDWYAEEVERAIAEAVRQYTAGENGSNREPVRQGAVWTDPRGPTTAVNLETEAHALTRGGILIRDANDPTLTRVEYVGWVYPTEFEFREYHCIQNPSLLRLSEVDLSGEAEWKQVMERIEAALLAVQRRLIERKAFDTLPRQGVLGFGISSARDWHDHVAVIPIESQR